MYIYISMASCKTLYLSIARTSIFVNPPSPRDQSIRLFSMSSLQSSISAVYSSNLRSPSPIPGSRKVGTFKTSIRQYGCVGTAVSVEASDYANEIAPPSDTIQPLEHPKDTVAKLWVNKGDVTKLMKMERRSEPINGTKWFPYLDELRAGGEVLSSGQVLEALDPYIMEVRKERFRNAVSNRSYSVCLVVEGLSDFGNASAAFRSADALGFQSVHVVSRDASKRCNMV